jgi:hypothetical protein
MHVREFPVEPLAKECRIVDQVQIQVAIHIGWKTRRSKLRIQTVTVTTDASQAGVDNAGRCAAELNPYLSELLPSPISLTHSQFMRVVVEV